MKNINHSGQNISGKSVKVLLLTLIMCALIMVSMLGCSNRSDTDSADSKEKLNIVTTTTMLADLAQELGGDKVNVSGLMGPGIDPHLYQASAGDVTKMQEADVVVYNGVHLEGKMGEIFASLDDQGSRTICAEDGLDTSQLLEDENDSSIHDPHIWFDVNNWIEVAKYTADKLSEYDPENADIYSANLEKYQTELEELNEFIKSRIDEVPEKQRVLVTAHDAFRYFGRAYDFEVMGLQGISTDAEAGTADVSNLADFISKNEIKAIFVESSVPPKNIEALQKAVKSRGFEVGIGGELYSDSLGDEASGHDSYIETFKANVNTIVDALK